MQTDYPTTDSSTSVPRREQRRGANLPALLSVGGYALIALVSLGFIAAGAGAITGVAKAPEREAVGYIGLFLVVTTAPVAWYLSRLAMRTSDDRMRRTLDGLIDSVRRLDESATLSPDARRVMNRRQEREMLCRAIEEDIQAQAWDAAIVLCNELSQRFGYRADAEEYRSRIEMARAEVQERKVSDAIARLDGLIVQRRWDVALQESARIGRLFPDSPRVENLRQRVETARGMYKQDLKNRFLEAARGERIDEAMVMLKELDAYLDESEAEPYREAARNVVAKARENLGAKFKASVQNKDWRTAVLTGRRITQEFPNTRMAEEVRLVWDGVLAKANAAANPAEPAASV